MDQVRGDRREVWGEGLADPVRRSLSLAGLAMPRTMLHKKLSLGQSRMSN